MESDLEDMAALETAEIALAINSLKQKPASVSGDVEQVYKYTQEDGTMVKLAEPYPSILLTRI